MLPNKSGSRNGYVQLLPSERTAIEAEVGLKPATGELLLLLMEQPEAALLEILRRLAGARPGLVQKAWSDADTIHPGGVVRSPLEIPQALPKSATGRTFSRELARPASRDHSRELPCKAPTVQFSSFTYFCHEQEASMALDIMRLGDCSEPSEVSFETRDKSAKAGEHYVRTSRRVRFDAGETTKVVEVPLCQNDEWDTTVEFAAELHEGEEGVRNAVLGRYLWASRVKIIDNDCFPSNKYSEYILSERISEAPKIGLFLEYVKFNWSNPLVRARTRRVMIIHQLHNFFGFGQLFINVYLVDYALNTAFNPKNLWLVGSRDKTLFLVVVSLLLPFGILHLLDLYSVNHCGVDGASRIRLQSALIRKFLNYDAAARLRVRNGEVIMGINRDSTVIVSKGYRGVLCLFQEGGQLALMLVYQLIAPHVFNKPFLWLSFLPVVMFPLSMFIFLRCRDRYTAELLSRRNLMQTRLVEAVEETVVNYRLIADYGQREKAVNMFENVVKDFNSASVAQITALLQDSYFAKWLALACVIAWTIIGGLEVCRGKLTLGMFLANVSVFQKIGVGWGSIYDLLIQISTTFPALANLTTALNFPTDIPHRKLVNRQIRSVTASIRDSMRKSLSTDSADVVVDHIPIAVGNLKFKYMTKGPSGGVRVVELNLKGLFKVQQGNLVCIVGPQGGGKSTLLKLIGGEMLPTPDDVSANPGKDDGQFIVPSHLRVFHVTSPLFFEGTLEDNLLFGVAPGDDDGRLERVQQICQKLGLDKEVVEQAESNAEHVWSDVLSSTQCQLLSIASALIANPEVLCIHKPTQTFDSLTATKVTEVFKEFVEKRGLVQLSPVSARRPRTCIMTLSRNNNLELADAVFDVSREHGIRRLALEEWKTGMVA